MIQHRLKSEGFSVEFSETDLSIPKSIRRLDATSARQSRSGVTIEGAMFAVAFALPHGLPDTLPVIDLPGPLPVDRWRGWGLAATMPMTLA